MLWWFRGFMLISWVLLPWFCSQMTKLHQLHFDRSFCGLHTRWHRTAGSTRAVSILHDSGDDCFYSSRVLDAAHLRRWQVFCTPDKTFWITVSSCSYRLESIWCCIPWCVPEKHYHDAIPDFATKGKSPKSPLNCLKELDQNNETALPGLQLGNQGICKNLQTSDLKKKMCFYCAYVL